MQTLLEQTVQAYSFTPKELQQVSLTLRGLYSGIEIEKVEKT